MQAETLWSLLNPEQFPFSAFEDAWQNVVLFNEHTWGSWNSISHPDADFTRNQWQTKRAFALDGDSQSRALLLGAVERVQSNTRPVTAVQVFNTSSWKRRGLAVVPKEWSTVGDLVRDGAGNPVPSQRLTTGELAFLATEVPPLGAAKFTLHAGAAFIKERAKSTDAGLFNELLEVHVDPATGATSTTPASCCSNSRCTKTPSSRSSPHRASSAPGRSAGGRSTTAWKIDSACRSRSPRTS